MSANENEPDRADQLTRLLTDLADDPQAPPSRVTAMSVIAAAKAAAAAPAGTKGDSVSVPASGDPGPTAEVVEFRPRRRRYVLAGLVAAASLAGISVLAVSLTVSGGSTTSTSADGARAVGTQAASSGDQSGAAELAAPAEPENAPSSALGELQQAAAGAAPEADSAAAGAAEGSVAAGSSAAASTIAASDAAAAGCWPLLGDPALTALTNALPPSAFRSPLSLTADCEPAAVGGVILPGTAPGTVLVVRVTDSVPAACLGGTTSDTTCTATGDGLYLAGDASGSPVVYAYGNGKQVVVSGWPASGDSVAIPSGLTVEQSAAAARAMLSSIG